MALVRPRGQTHLGPDLESPGTVMSKASVPGAPSPGYHPPLTALTLSTAAVRLTARAARWPVPCPRTARVRRVFRT